MSGVQPITVSSQLKSANAVTDIENHSGKKNRETYAHKNDDIDQSKSHLNAEFDFYDRRELLGEHYKDTIEKHNGNKNNKSEARRWDLDKYLESFEGKTVKSMGKATKNARWSTASQISYFGGKDSLNDVLEALEDAGATPEEIRAAYLSGYEEYVQLHNEKFMTLPIYHSDVHFDETTPHGHDAIVVMGHTEKGRASDSINNALGEMYGYQKTFAGNQENMARYREENDGIMFDAIGSKLEALGASHGVDFKFEFLRTGQTESDSYEDYKKKMDFQNTEEKLQEKEKGLEFRSKAQKNISEKNRERKRELDTRENALSARESDLAMREASVIAREKEERQREEYVQQIQAEKVQQLKSREQQLAAKEQNLKKHEAVANAVAVAVLNEDPKRENILAQFKDQGVFKFKPESVQKVLTDSIKEANSGVRRRQMGEDYFIKKHVYEQTKDDGPEL